MGKGIMAPGCAYKVMSDCLPRFKKKFTGFPYKEKAYTFINMFVKYKDPTVLI